MRAGAFRVGEATYSSTIMGTLSLPLQGRLDDFLSLLEQCHHVTIDGDDEQEMVTFLTAPEGVSA